MGNIEIEERGGYTMERLFFFRWETKRREPEEAEYEDTNVGGFRYLVLQEMEEVGARVHWPIKPPATSPGSTQGARGKKV